MIKHKKIKILLLSIILILISSCFIIFKGRTYSVKINNVHAKIKLDNNNIKIVDKKIVDNKLIVKFKGVKKGNTLVSIPRNSQIGESFILYVHPFGVITNDEYLGGCNGGYIIPISICILLIYIIIIVIMSYKKSIKENLYQYKNIAYLGIILFLSLFFIMNLYSIFNYKGLISTINRTIYFSSLFSIILLPILFIISILLIISNITLMKKEGISFKNMLGVFFSIFFCLAPFLPDVIYDKLTKLQIINIYNLNSPGPYIYMFFESFIYISIAYIEFILIGTIILGIKSALHKPMYNKDYIIILGCKIKSNGTLTPLLKGRVDRALKFRNNQLNKTGKDLIFIPSGGKGSDEVISEGEAIKNYLIEKGIKEEKIIVENKSKNTYENIKFSNKLIKKGSNVAYSTTNYHVLRAGLIATEQSLLFEGMGSNTKSYFWINAFIREFIGTLYSEKKKHIIIFLFIILLLVIMILIKYFTTNM